ncbi:MAG: hypothetical protein MJZ16_10985, partial [Bacteroidales bacterium]|nr:hypothetical protein [Bacteroidales bacterium]
MADNNTPQNSSALDSFLAKLGTVLSMTKDAIIADFVGDIPSYVSNLASTNEIKDYDTFKKSFADSADALEKFITYIFNRLGYDLTTFKKNKELVDLVKSLLVTMDSLGTTVSELFGDDIKWMDEAEKLAKSAQEEGGVLQSADKIYKDISGKEQGLIASLGEGAISFGSSTENDGKLVKIIQTITQIVELIIKFKDFEWSNIKNEYKDFGKFVDKTYFNEKFAERLFDHILTVLLSKAKEVFDDEIKAVAKNIEAFKKDIERTVAEAKGQIEKSASEILKEIKALEKQIEQIRKQIESEATRLYNEARQQALAAKKQIEGTVQDFYNQVSGELQAQYRTLENELLALTKTSLGDFGKIGDILNRVYQVLDFMGLLEKKTIEIATYVEGVGIKDLNIPVSEIEALLSVAVPAYDGKTPAADLQKKADEAIAELKSKIPTVEINVISWSRLGQIFTSPENYFKEVFPVKDYDDAEKLLAKISNLVRSFNPDIPDFSSVSKIINELLVRVQKAIDELPGDATKELKDKINAVKKFLLDIKKVLECYAIAFKKQISEAFDTVKGGADSIIKQLSTDVQKAVSEARAELEKSGKGLLTLAQTNIKWRDFSSLKMDAGTKDFLYRTFGKPFEEVVIENAAEYKLLEGIDPKEWGSAVTKAFSEVGSSGSSLVNGYVDIIKEIEKRIKDTFDSKAWEAKFDKLTGELKTEFEKQTAGIPMNVDQLKSFSEDTLKKLINGDKVDNPFSSFDFSEYLSIVSDNVKAIVPTDLDIYYTKFRTVTVDGINGLLSSVSGISTAIDSTAKDLKTTAEDKADALKNFAIDVFTEYWDKLKDSIIKNVIRPVLTLIEKAVKEWTKKLLERILSEVIAYVKSLDINPQDYQKALSEAKETAEATVKTVSQILMVADDVQNNGV